MNDNKYHEIFIPLTDVYDVGGSDVFKNIGAKEKGKKNLVVFPVVFYDNLEKLVERESTGAEDTLAFLKENAKKSSNEYEKSDKNKTPKFITRRLSDNLDIGFVEKTVINNENFSVIDLEKEASEKWTSEQGEGTIITLNDAQHTKLSNRGLRVEEPEFLQVNEDIVNRGIIRGNDNLLNALYQNDKKINLEDAEQILGADLFHNQFIRWSSPKGPNNEVFARVTMELQKNKSGSRITDTKNGKVILLDEQEYGKCLSIGNEHLKNILNIYPKDMEQYFALQYGLLNPETQLLFIPGRAGSGKTLLSYVAAMDSVLIYSQETREKRFYPDHKGGRYKKIILLKPNEIIGGRRRDIGALPGNMYEKLKPHLEPYRDAHKESCLGREIAFEDLLLHSRIKNEFGEPRNKQIQDKKINNDAHLPIDEVIEVMYSGVARGRSLQDTLILVDEAQNFTPYEMKTIIERAGEGSKCVVMGDPFQLDNPYCSTKINGLTSAIKHYLGRPYVALIYLSRNYRSQMSEDADTWKVHNRHN